MSKAKEFALGTLTTMPDANWSDSTASARAFIEAARKAIKEQVGAELTVDLVRGMAGHQMEVVAAMHRIADEMETSGVPLQQPPEPQLRPWIGQPGEEPPLLTCPICKKVMHNDDGRGFLMIHATCAPKE
jgi:hypothetical protein